MDISEILARHISNREMIVYQAVRTEAVTLRCDEYPCAYSILVLRVEDGAVTESGVVYDVSRDPDKCLWVMDKLIKLCAEPHNAVDIASDVL